MTKKSIESRMKKLANMQAQVNAIESRNALRGGGLLGAAARQIISDFEKQSKPPGSYTGCDVCTCPTGICQSAPLLTQAKGSSKT